MLSNLFKIFKHSKKVLASPVNGIIKEITAVDDEGFASKVVGDGFAVSPTDGSVVAPIDGLVAAVFHTGHAIVIKNDEGIEVLIHVGIDSVTLNGEGFHVKIEEGQRVKIGDLLLVFDFALLKQKIPSLDVIVVLTSGQQCCVIEPGKQVAMGEENVAEIM